MTNLKKPTNSEFFTRSRSALQIEKTEESLLEEYEYLMLVENVQRRSNSQISYVKQTLTGILAQIAILGYDKILQTHESKLIIPDQALLTASLGIAVITFILMLFWLDDAITIAGIERYFQKSEGQKNMWYNFRSEHLNNGKDFKLKAKLYNIAVIGSFCLPSILVFIYTVFLSESEVKTKVIVLVTSSVLLASAILIIRTWRTQAGSIYTHCQAKKGS